MAIIQAFMLAVGGYADEEPSANPKIKPGAAGAIEVGAITDDPASYP